MTDLRQTKEYTRYMEMLGWNALQLNNELGIRNYAYVRKIPLVGNIAKVQRPSQLPTISQIESLRKKHNLSAVYVEPAVHNSLVVPGFIFARNCFLPPKTIHIDLTQSEKVIFNQMKSKTRYNTRVAQKRGVKVLPSQDITTFIELWHQSARHRRFFFSQEKEIKALWGAFGKKAHLLLAISDILVYRKYPLAGVLIARSATTAYYMYAASTREGNKLSTPTLLVWEAIKLAKRARCKIFDFEGIYDERYPQTKSWKGFSRFKEGFGGKVTEYPPTLVRYYNPLLQLLKL